MTDLGSDVYGKVATDVATKIIENSLGAVTGVFSEGVRKAKLKFRSGFHSYIHASLARTGRIKTILDPDTPVELENIYVALKFMSQRGKKFSEADVMSAFAKTNRLLVMGTAGGGKSMFLRKVNISLIKDYKSVLPIYYELRTLNSATQDTMLEAIFFSVGIHINSMTLEEFSDAIRSGRFALVLDGFDEIDYDKRRKYLRELNELCENYPHVKVMMTSRREDSVEHLRSFAVYNVLPMTKEQIIELLTKIDYDIETKASFIKRVDSDLFDKHRDFLSIPLLATMMLLTFSQYSDIPSKIHIFYQQAFEVLFQRHDRSKGGA